MKKIIITLIILSSLISVVQAEKTVFPEESNEVIKSYRRGFQTLNGEEGYTETTFGKAVTDRSSVSYIRIDWKTVNPQEGVYKWDIIERAITASKKFNQTVGVCFMPVGVNSASNYAQSTPDWVFDKGMKYTTEFDGALKVPVWDDPIFMQEFKRFIEALADKYDGNPDIAYFDTSNYGNWGEWHNWGLENSEDISLEKLNEHVDMWSVFKKTLVLMVTNGKKNTLYGAAQHGLDAHRFGIRRNGTVNPSQPFDHQSLALAYDKVPAVAEWWFSYSQFTRRGVWEEITFENVLRQSRPSIMAISQWDEDYFVDEEHELLDRWINRVGYWLKPIKITYPDNLVAGSNEKISFLIKNDGLAPFYPNRENIGYVKLALIDSKNNITDTVLLDGINPYNWKPEAFVNEAASFKFDSDTSDKRLAIGIFSDLDIDSPNVQMGIKAERVDNWYILDSMTELESPDIADNKVYKASDEYAEFGYGYHEARYAFDKDDKTTWLARITGEGAWLEIDFGEEREFSTAFMLPVGSEIKSYKIQTYSGGVWKDVHSGNAISRSGDFVHFEKQTSKKVRILITEGNEVVGLAQFKIF